MEFLAFYQALISQEPALEEEELLRHIRIHNNKRIRKVLLHLLMVRGLVLGFLVTAQFSLVLDWRPKETNLI